MGRFTQNNGKNDIKSSQTTNGDYFNVITYSRIKTLLGASLAWGIPYKIPINEATITDYKTLITYKKINKS